jgi:major membrane immunogen (membrane-anchored lipoprotein)
MKVIIAGSRGFKDYELLKKVCDKMLSNTNKPEIEIVSGTALGADTLGERYAIERAYKLRRFPADWNKHGKKSGYIRNKEMAEYADALIIFWDKISKGSKHMIDLARARGLKIRIQYFK